jgi:hypothetical protein
MPMARHLPSAYEAKFWLAMRFRLNIGQRIEILAAKLLLFVRAGFEDPWIWSWEIIPKIFETLREILELGQQPRGTPEANLLRPAILDWVNFW